MGNASGGDSVRLLDSVLDLSAGGGQASPSSPPAAAAAAGQAAPSSPSPALPAPPADGRCLLENLRSTLWIVVCSYLSYEWRTLERYAGLSRSFRETFRQESSWQHLCRDFWFVQEEHFRQWPRIKSWKVLYRLLEQWAVLEGFYSLPAAFPYCLLVLLRFEAGALVAEAVRFCPAAGGEAEADAESGRSALEVRARLFEVTFTEEEGGVRTVLTFPRDERGLVAGRGAVVAPLPPVVAAVVPRSRDFRHRDQVVPQWLAARRGLCVQLDSLAGASSSPSKMVGAWGRALTDSLAEWSTPSADSRASGAGPKLDLWREHAWELQGGPGALVEVTEQMVLNMLSHTGSLPLALVRSPLEYDRDDPLAPHLRPGLYVGNYGHDMYGQYRYEVLLVEFRECTRDGLDALFARPFEGGGVPQELRQAVEQSGEHTFSFLVGTKVTGDFHVPAGQTTFVALLSPRPVRQRLMIARGGDLTTVRNRSTQLKERVVDAWPGFGTLAMPGFHEPSWAPGSLGRFEGLADRRPALGGGRGGDRFGFMWQRNQEAVVLEYIEAQTTSPFLNRKWLPENLR